MSRQAMPVQTGNVIDYTNTTGALIPVGDIIPLGTICGVAETDIEDGRIGVVNIVGVWDVPSVTGAFDVGDLLYWDAVAKKATKTDTDNTPLGITVASKGASATTARVKLGAPISVTNNIISE
jgi:predicted RecA/RadA family phage recombinase